MVQLSFTNETKKKIDRAKFGLIVMDSDGTQSPYGKALTFTAGADPGKMVSAQWALDLEKVDIEHMGETVYLESVEFADGTSLERRRQPALPGRCLFRPEVSCRRSVARRFRSRSRPLVYSRSGDYFQRKTCPRRGPDRRRLPPGRKIARGSGAHGGLEDASGERDC